MNRVLIVLWIAGLLIVPTEVTAQAECAAPRLLPGAQAILTSDANRVRSQPRTGAQQVGLIYGGAVFDVIDGYVCAEGYTWWYVQLGEIIGWTVDGTADEAFAAPFGIDALPPLTATALTWSPDGARLAVGTNRGAQVYDAGDFAAEPLKVGRPANFVTFAPTEDALLLVAFQQTYEDYAMAFYDAANGALVDQLSLGASDRSTPQPVTALAYAPDSAIYVYINDDRAYAMLSVSSRWNISTPLNDADAVSITPGRSVALLYADEGGQTVGVYDLAVRPRQGRPGDHLLVLPLETTPSVLAASRVSEQIAVGDAVGGVSLWDAESAERIAEVVVAEMSIAGIAAAPDGDFAVFAGDSVYVLAADTLTVQASYVLDAAVIAAAFSPDSALLAVATVDTLTLFDRAEAAPVMTVALTD